MSQPASYAEYAERFARNETVTGFGMEVTVHIPCAWCAAADFNQWRLLDAHTGMQQDRTCADCGRSGRWVQSLEPVGGPDVLTVEAQGEEVSRIEHGGWFLRVTRANGDDVSYEFVQTGGPDAPEWLRPAPRRIGR